MYTKDGIAYAGKQKPAIKICGVKPLAQYKLWLRFTNDEERIFDFTPELVHKCFMPLSDEETFRSVYLDYGVTVWNDGTIDIAPEYLYEHSAPVEVK